jgi:hypothetical protein
LRLLQLSKVQTKATTVGAINSVPSQTKGGEHMSILEVIVELRGGVPERCDFCSKPFTEQNYATPEEAGDWACIECVMRWDKEVKEKNT